jgi:hypothetical protein
MVAGSDMGADISQARLGGNSTSAEKRRKTPYVPDRYASAFKYSGKNARKFAQILGFTRFRRSLPPDGQAMMSGIR